QALSDTLDRLRIDWLRDGDLFFIRLPESRAAALANDEPEARIRGRRAVVRVDAFPALRHVTLYWPEGAELIRHDVEADLLQRLEALPTPPNPVAAWMFSIAGSLFALMFFTVTAMILFMYFLSRAQQT